MKKLSMTDVGFLVGESREMPMHVAGVNLYTLPDGADEQEFLKELADKLRDFDKLLPPYGDRLKTGPLGLAGPAYWEPDPELDIDYHIRHSALPKPGRYRELFTLASRLHGSLLDRSRPLWEIHLIEGLQNRQFATYMKTHHAAIDGARSIHIARSMLSVDPNARFDESPLSKASWDRYRASLKQGRSDPMSDQEIRNVAQLLKTGVGSGVQVFNALKRFSEAWAGRGGALSLPFRDVPRSSINTSIAGARRFVAQTWPFARIRAVGKAFDGTFNDAVLAMCSGALREYMEHHGEILDQSLKAMVPVSLREAGDVDSGNAVSAISADLATNIKDPAKRIAAIKASTQAGKDFFKGLSNNEIMLVSAIMQAPAAVLMPLGLASRFPAVNIAISNVPGIRETMYFNGARMDGSYPASIVAEGMALNITLVTYGENVDFGITACRRSVPHVQRLIDYMEDALVDLEDAAGITYQAPASRRKKSAPSAKSKKKAPARKKAPAKAKAAAKKAKPKSKATARKKAPAKAKRAAKK